MNRRRTFRLALVAMVAALSVLGVSRHAWATIYLADPDPARNDRFYAGIDKDFLGASYDWSGVGRTNSTGDTSRWVTMISDSYFLSSAHWIPSGTVEFRLTNDPNETPITRSILSGEVIAGTDLYLGKLDSAVPTSVAKYPVLVLPSLQDYYGRELLNAGLSVAQASGASTTVRVGRNNVDNDGIFLVTDDLGVTAAALTYSYNTNSSLGGDEDFLNPGDSGGPSFSVLNGALTLVGIHWFNDGVSIPSNGDFSGDTFLAGYVARVQQRMSGEQLVVVPEPTGLALLLMATATGVMWSAVAARRRRAALRLAVLPASDRG